MDTLFRCELQVKPRVNKAQTGVETAGVKHSMNPFDELSVEESVRIREGKKTPVEDICVISAGPTKAQDILRTAMAMGADRAIHVETKEGEDLEPLGVAKLLKAAAEQNKSNLVILGKQSIDDDAGQTGQMLAGLLGWAQATQASKVEFNGDVVQVTREVDGGVETLKAKLPMVITTDLRLNEPRYASLPNIMKAKKKPLEKKTLADFGITAEKRLKTIKVTGKDYIYDPRIFAVDANSCRLLQSLPRDRVVARSRMSMAWSRSSRNSVLFKQLVIVHQPDAKQSQKVGSKNTSSWNRKNKDHIPTYNCFADTDWTYALLVNPVPYWQRGGLPI